MQAHERRPHHLEPKLDTIRVVFAYKNFAANKGISHIGLGVAGENTSRTLRQHGIHAEVWPIVSARDLDDRLTKVNSNHREPPVTHVMISAPWIPTLELQKLCSNHSEVVFTVTSHSNVGFLQADPGALKLIREALHLEVGCRNFSFAGNNQRFTNWVERAYHRPCAFLPNLYDVTTFQNHPKPAWRGESLRIGCFGAIRAQKNTLTAAAAALELAARLNVTTEFFVNSGRNDGGATETIRRALREMFEGQHGVMLREHNWSSWPEFRHLVHDMDVCLQPSYTESFNMVTADAIAECVPSVVSDVIDWAPPAWVAQVDSAVDIADKALLILYDNRAWHTGQEALRRYVRDGVEQWKKFLLRVR